MEIGSDMTAQLIIHQGEIELWYWLGLLFFFSQFLSSCSTFVSMGPHAWSFHRCLSAFTYNINDIAQRINKHIASESKLHGFARKILASCSSNSQKQRIKQKHEKSENLKSDVNSNKSYITSAHITHPAGRDLAFLWYVYIYIYPCVCVTIFSNNIQLVSEKGQNHILVGYILTQKCDLVWESPKKLDLLLILVIFTLTASRPPWLTPISPWLGAATSLLFFLKNPHLPDPKVTLSLLFTSPQPKFSKLFNERPFPRDKERGT